MKLNKNIIKVVLCLICSGIFGNATNAGEYNVLVISSDVIPRNLADSLAVIKSTSKIIDRINDGYLNQNFYLQAEKSPEKKSMTRVGVYASLWTGEWPDKHGAFGLKSDRYNFEDYPTLFSQLSEQNKSLNGIFYSSDKLLKTTTAKAIPQVIFKENNEEVFNQARETIQTSNPHLLWVHWSHEGNEDIRDTYILANYSKKLIGSIIERPTFLDENWLFIYLGLPVMESSLENRISDKGFIIADSIGQTEKFPVLHSAHEFAPSLMSYLSQNSDEEDEGNQENAVNESGLEPGVENLMPAQNITAQTEKMEGLSDQLEKLTVYLRYLPETIKEESNRKELEQRKAQDKINQIIFNNLSNRLNNVNMVSSNYQQNSGDLMNRSMKMALTVVVILMVICMGTFIATTIIQTKNSKQLAQIIQSFAAYKSQQIHSEHASKASTTEQKYSPTHKDPE